LHFAARLIAPPGAPQIERAGRVEGQRGHRRNAARGALLARVESLAGHVDGDAEARRDLDLGDRRPMWHEHDRGEQPAYGGERPPPADTYATGGARGRQHESLPAGSVASPSNLRNSVAVSAGRRAARWTSW